MTLTWQAPLVAGSEPVDDYVVQMSRDGALWTTVDDGVGDRMAARVRQLTNGHRYWFRVAAASWCGPGPWSRTVSTLAGLPGAPRLLGGTTDQSEVTLSWSYSILLAHGSRVVDWRIQYAPEGGAWQRFRDGVTSTNRTTVTGLSADVTYRFRVAAVNAVGRGPFSAPVRITARVDAPELPVVTALEPASGPVAGGTLLTIVGAHFTEAYRVNFAGRAGTDLVVLGDGRLRVRTPRMSDAVVVTPQVMTPGGVSVVDGPTFVYE